MKYMFLLLILPLLIISCKNVDVTKPIPGPESPIPSVEHEAKQKNEIVIDSTNSIDTMVTIRSKISLRNDIKLPVIHNRILGIEEEVPYELITKIRLISKWGGFYFLVPPDSCLNGLLRVVFATGEYRFERMYELLEIRIDEDTINGYFIEISFERKFWIDNNQWNIEIYHQHELLYKELFQFNAYNAGILFKNDSNDPFVTIREKTAVLGDEYKFRYNNENKPIVAVYKSDDWATYTPILYFQTNDDKVSTVKVVFNTPGVIYYFAVYPQGELPNEEKTLAIFDFIQVM